MLHHRPAWFAALAAPVLAGALLLGPRSAGAVFALYHGAVCLLMPALVARSQGRSWRQHARDLGLLDAQGRWPTAAIGAGLAAAAVLAAIPPVACRALPALFPDPAHLLGTLAGWGLGREQVPWALGFLVLVGAPAEELFWRGWLHTHLVHRRRRRWPAAAALAALFTSYHAVTLQALAPTPAAASLMLVAVLAAAATWSWWRERSGSVWPALLTHAGAALGYGLVAAARLG